MVFIPNPTPAAPATQAQIVTVLRELRDLDAKVSAIARTVDDIENILKKRP